LNFLELSPGDKVFSLFAFGKKDADQRIQYLVMVTKNGIIKKVSLGDFRHVRRSGLIAITLKKGDELRGVRKTTGQDDIILVSRKGQAIRFREQQIRAMGRNAAGIRAIRLKKGDEVIGVDIIQAQSPKNPVGFGPLRGSKLQAPKPHYLLVASENGYGKRTDIREYRLQSRGGSGIKTAKVTPKTGELAYAKVLSGQEEDLVVISRKAQVIRTSIESIPKISRSTQGVRIMRLEEQDKVVSAACL